MLESARNLRIMGEQVLTIQKCRGNLGLKHLKWSDTAGLVERAVKLVEILYASLEYSLE